MNLFRKWSSREYPLCIRLITTLSAGVVFVMLIPYLLLILLPRLDRFLHFPRLNLGAGNLVLGILMLLVGVGFAWWTIGSQLFDARGTPIPAMPTQQLLTNGPFSYCRNPMTLGTFSAYLGLSLWVGSISAVLVVVIFAFLLILYIKKVEEQELELRFGQPYTLYKQTTPFLIPRIPRDQQK